MRLFLSGFFSNLLEASRLFVNTAFFLGDSMMKTFRSMVVFALAALFLSSCVSRTIYTAPQQRGANAKGYDKQEKVKGTKLVWIWQKEFSNP
jgi:hypothetical protein